MNSKAVASGDQTSPLRGAGRDARAQPSPERPKDDIPAEPRRRGAPGLVRRSDERVRDEVLNTLFWDLALPHSGLEVKVEKGWVTLSGNVYRDYQKQIAEQDVLRVSGVSGVTNNLVLHRDEAAARWTAS